jgi:hypothetical protein
MKRQGGRILRLQCHDYALTIPMVGEIIERLVVVQLMKPSMNTTRIDDDAV